MPIAPSTNHASRTRPAPARNRGDALLLPRLKRTFEINFSRYGDKELWRALGKEGLEVGRDRVARPMKTDGTRGARRAKRIVTTIAAPASRALPDLVKRHWDTGEPDRVSFAGLTYVPSSEGMV